MQREDLAKFDVPDTPGVYFFLRGGDLLYIGKATSLHDRVRSYFSKDLAVARSSAIAAMIERADEVRFVKTDSVLEALILEANLIKKHQPPYNTDERDNKSFNYLVITRESFPRIITIRGRELFDPTVKKDFVVKHLFGPFPQGGSLKEALKIVRKIFPYRDTCIPESGKPCFNAQIGLCPGVCSGTCSRLDYAHNVRNITDLFKGNFHGLKKRLIREMRTAADAERFEEATTLRRQVLALEHIRDVSLIKDESRVAGGGSIRIEGYDVAHTAGKETVGVMTVVDGGEAEKGQYRKFTIRTAGNDDPAALAEMLERRLAHTEWPYPKLIVVDGGITQLRRAQAVLKKVGVSIPVVGVVKNDRHKPERLIGDIRAIQLYEKDILLVNAEAHRFSIEWHRTRLRNRLV
ncbi:MAG: hypothetical protein RLZZ342_14 [Candidatus Parcubacteria bacterium]|jgi:excinuclease ABC subunit C